MIPKAYCINLDRRPDRWQMCVEEFAKHNLEVERFAAIDGKAIGISPVEAFTASHCEVINQAAALKLPAVMIFEDDVVLHDNFCELLENCTKWLPDDWSILYLGGSHRQKPYPVNMHIYNVSHTLTTHAYIIRSVMYYYVYSKLAKAVEPADCVFAAIQKEFNCYITNPPLGWQRGGYSDIEGRYMEYEWLKSNEQ